jgi:hypothetical protein
VNDTAYIFPLSFAQQRLWFLDQLEPHSAAAVQLDGPLEHAALAASRAATARQLAAEEARQPFDLTQGPLLRVSLLQLDATAHLLLLRLHHLIADGWSLPVLI